MEEILHVLVFGLGATIGLKAVKAAETRWRPALKEVIKGGIAATERARSLAARPGFPAPAATASTAEPSRKSRRAPGRSRPTRIEIVRE